MVKKALSCSFGSTLCFALTLASPPVNARCQLPWRPRRTMPLDPPSLTETNVASDPVVQFATWFDEEHTAGQDMPEAAAVATATTDVAPSVRMVLVKEFDVRGFVFFTNYDGRKGRELDENPRAALLFYWPRLGRQVRIEGPARRVSPQETERYVHSRPRGSQLSALASPQSRVVESRAALEQRV